MLNSILFAVAITQASITLPEPRDVISEEISVDSTVLMADISTELELQIKQLSQAITQSISEGALFTEKENLVTVKD